MPTFITLVRWTDQGIKAVKDSPSRHDAAEQAMSAAGGAIKQTYMVLGDYDLVVIWEAPSDEAYASTMLRVASAGNVRTTTLKAFSEEEYRRITAAIL